MKLWITSQSSKANRGHHAGRFWGEHGQDIDLGRFISGSAGRAGIDLGGCFGRVRTQAVEIEEHGAGDDGRAAHAIHNHGDFLITQATVTFFLYIINFIFCRNIIFRRFISIQTS